MPAGIVLVTLAATIGGGVVPANQLCDLQPDPCADCSAQSALYHRRVWFAARLTPIVRRLDHSMIFVFIAGTYTPFSVLLLPYTTAIVVLSGGLGAGAVPWCRHESDYTGTRRRWVAAPAVTSRSAGSPSFVLPDIARNGGVTRPLPCC